MNQVGKSGKASLKAAATLTLLMMLLTLAPAKVSAQEAPIAETPHKIGFWDINVLQSTTTLFSTTSECTLLYEGKCNVDGNVMFDCYADAQATCRCYVESDTTNKCGGGTTPPPTTGKGGGSSCVQNSECSSNQCIGGICKSVISRYVCQDSDGGINLVQKGTATEHLGTLQTGSSTDFCSSNDQTIIFESYCSPADSDGDSNFKNAAYPCPSATTCSDGACKTTIVTGPCTGKSDFTVIDKYCADNTAFKTTCIGGVARTAQQSCTNLGKTCQNDECQVISGGGIVCGNSVCESGESTTSCLLDCKSDGGGGESGVFCCKGERKIGVNSGEATLYTRDATTFRTCISGDSRVAEHSCTVNDLTSLGLTKAEVNGEWIDLSEDSTLTEEQKKAKEAAAKVKFQVPISSIPSFTGESIDNTRAATVLKSICMIDEQCKSEFCDQSDEIRKQLENKVPDVSAVSDSETPLGSVSNPILGNLQLSHNIATETEIFKAGEEVSGICRTKPEKLDFNQFFKDNQTAILIGGGIFIFFMLYSMVKK